MNVFVLCTGRCGSRTFFEACRHITNYTCGHETRCTALGDERLAYPDRHIEIDNRLSWLLGRLGERFGDDAFYAHLVRDRDATAASFNQRWGFEASIVRAYSRAILMRQEDGLDVALDFYDTVNANIRAFLAGKPRTMVVNLETAVRDFAEFWQRIGAAGDRDAALATFQVRHNASPR